MLPPIKQGKNKLSSSVVLLSLHKSGSTLLTKLLRDWSADFSYSFCDIPGFVFGQGGQWPNGNKLKELYSNNEGTVWGGYRHIPNWLENLLGNRTHSLKVISLTRNPLDCLTSMYYSHKKSHIVPKRDGPSKEGLLKERERLQDLTLEDYVESIVEDDIRGENTLLKRYRHHFDVINALPKQQLLTFDYDSFVYRKYESLLKISSFIADQKLDNTSSHKTIFDIVAKHDLFPLAEKDSQHVRNVMPGDFYRKVEPPKCDALAKRVTERVSVGIPQLAG